MSIDSGRDMYRATRNPRPPLPLDAATLRRSGVARGRAMRAARGGDRDVRAALASAAREDTETTPPAA